VVTHSLKKVIIWQIDLKKKWIFAPKKLGNVALWQFFAPKKKWLAWTWGHHSLPYSVLSFKWCNKLHQNDMNPQDPKCFSNCHINKSCHFHYFSY